MSTRMLGRRLAVVDRATATRWRPSVRMVLNTRVLTDAERTVLQRLVKRIVAVSPQGLTVRELELSACLRARMEGSRTEPCELEGCGDALGDAQTG